MNLNHSIFLLAVLNNFYIDDESSIVILIELSKINQQYLFCNILIHILSIRFMLGYIIQFFNKHPDKFIQIIIILYQDSIDQKNAEANLINLHEWYML